MAPPDLRAVDVPAWIAALTDADLHRQLGPSCLERGRRYALSGAVLAVDVAEDGRRVVAGVRGSAHRRYTTVLSPGSKGLRADCSCPVSTDCKHAAAVLFALRRHAPGPPAAEPPAWERRLAPLVAAHEDAGTPLALLVEVVEPPRSGRPGARLRLRPARPGAAGKWVRTGASWREVEQQYYGLSPRPAHRDALLPVLAGWRARQPSWVSTYTEPTLFLDDVGPAAFRLLADAVAAGVVLLDGRGQPTVRLAQEPARLAVDLRRDAGGDLVVQPALGVPGEAGTAVLVGRPASGLFHADGDGLLLVPVDPPLDDAAQALLAGGPVAVPAGDVPRFWRRYYPRLARRAACGSSDGSAEPPVLQPPRLALDVVLGERHTATLAWSYRYPGEPDVVVPLGGAPAGPDAAAGPDVHAVRDADAVRDTAAEQALLAALADLPDADGVWAAGAPRSPLPRAHLAGLATARFVAHLLPLLEQHDGVEVTVHGTPLDYRDAVEAPVVEVAVRDGSGRDWFDLAVTVRVGAELVPLPELLAALAGQQTHLVLDGGVVVALDVPELQALRTLLEESRGLAEREPGRLRVTALQAGLWEELVALGVVREQSERWSRTVGGLLDLQQAPDPEPPRKLDAELRPYQLHGYRWLAHRWDLGLGAVLADDMGLGKTLQVLALALRAYEADDLDAPLLVVAPTSVVGAWVEQAARFTPDLPVVAVTETERRSGRPVAERVRGAAVVVTSYALLRLDEPAWLDLPWRALVLDEAQHVKNPAARTYAVARKLPAPVKLAVTGTPLENSLLDLWALLSIVAPGLYPDLSHFTEHYRRPVESGEAPERLAALRRRIGPLMLRRTKEQVAVDLPPKVEQVVEVALFPAHRRAYDRHLQRERQRVLGLLDDLQRNRFAVLKALTTLRQLALDPSLVDGAAAPAASGRGGAPAKIEVLAEMLEEVVREGHRALVFSSFTGFLGRVRDRLDADGVGYCYLDGRTRDRPRRIEQWRTGSDPVFLISLKAGGTGLTLTEADYVFVLDPWWNPAVEAQAVDRAHRIGQSRTVMVYRLVAADTVEQKVLALQDSKRALFDAVVAGDTAGTGALTADDVRALLA